MRVCEIDRFFFFFHVCNFKIGVMETVRTNHLSSVIAKVYG